MEKRALATKVVSRGTGHYGSPRGLSVARSSLKQAPRVVTDLPTGGAVISQGSVLFTISGRPTFLLDAADEVVFVPATPLRVSKVDAKLGTEPQGVLVTAAASGGARFELTFPTAQ